MEKQSGNLSGWVGAAIGLALMIFSNIVFVSKLRALTDWGTGLRILAGIGIYLAAAGVGYGIGKVLNGDSSDKFIPDLFATMTPVVCAVLALIFL